MLSMLDYLLQQLEGGDPAFVGLRAVHLCWSARSQDCFHTWPGELFHRLQRSKFAPMFKLHLHCTGTHGSAARKSVATMQVNPAVAAYSAGSEVPMMTLRANGSAVTNVPPPPPLPPAVPAPLGAVDVGGRAPPPAIPSRRPVIHGAGVRLAPLASDLPAASAPPAVYAPQSPSASPAGAEGQVCPAPSPLASPSAIGFGSSPMSIRPRLSFRASDEDEGASASAHVPLGLSRSPSLRMDEFAAVQSGRISLSNVFFGLLKDSHNLSLSDLPETHVARLSGVKSRSVAVMACGPEPMVAEAQQQAANCGFYFHKETFAF